MDESQIQRRDAAIEEIAARLGVRAERGRRFAELTSLRVGGAIDWVISPETEEQAAAIVHELDEAGIGWRALGSGSNVLADDGEHHYVVLSLKDLKGEVQFDGELVSGERRLFVAASVHRRCAARPVRHRGPGRDSRNCWRRALDECRSLRSRDRNSN